MEFKGTKGEWIHTKSNTGSYIILCDNQYLGTFRDEHDAKISASAPDLLEALIKLTANAGLQKYVRDNQGTLLSESFDKAKQAIEKALK